MVDKMPSEKQSMDRTTPLNTDTVIYQLTSQHWAHAEQIRWTLLHNLRVANTILLLAWAAISATNTRPVGAWLPRPAYPLVESLLDGADLVLHGTDAVFDRPSAHLPSHRQYVGALLWEPPSMMPPFLAEPRPPWVLMTLSLSPQQGQIQLARAALTALAAQPVRLLLSLSERHPRDELLPLPENARVESYVPHAEALKRACLLVSHAGHGVVLKSLDYGVPMVLVPWGRDQPGVAARAF